jgi:hypothetical protein
MSKEKVCWICRRTESEVKAALEKLSPEIVHLADGKAAEGKERIMLPAKTNWLRENLKGVYRCAVCDILLTDCIDDNIDRRTQEDLLTEKDIERIHFDISATIEPE